MPTPVALLSNATRAVRPMFRAMSIAASGLSAERFRMEVAATNIANAETVDKQGHAYQRQLAVLAPGTSATVGGGPGNWEAMGAGEAFGGLEAGILPGVVGLSTTAAGDSARSFQVPVLQDMAQAGNGGDGLYGVAIRGTAVDNAPGALVYDPGNPGANQAGYVQMPNVHITDETVNLMEARRAYEANASVFQSAKAMLKRALEI